MFNSSEYYRSHQQLSFISPEGQKLLSNAKVLVIGAGGLGCPCMITLAGAGAGIIGIADYDTIEISNLHRQTLYNYADKGKMKVVVAEEKLNNYNPFINMQIHPIAVDETNVLQLISAYDLVIDGTDNFFSRYLINDACVFLDKPLIYGAIHQAEGHVTVFNFKNSPTLRCLFPKDENEIIPSCAEIGAYNVTTGIIGMMMANEAIKIIVHHEDVLAGKLNQVDILPGKILQVKYNEIEGSRQKSIDRFTKASTVKTISKKELKEKIKTGSPFCLIDVREKDEHEIFNIGGDNIPLSEFLATSDFNFSSTDEIILYCEKGSRSNQAAAYLASKGFSSVASLEGGMVLWQKISANI